MARSSPVKEFTADPLLRMELELLGKVKAKTKTDEKPRPSIEYIAVGFEFSYEFYDQILRIVDSHVEEYYLRMKFKVAIDNLKTCRMKTRTGMKFMGAVRCGGRFVRWSGERDMNIFWKGLPRSSDAKITGMYYTLNGKILVLNVKINGCQYMAIVVNDERDGRGGRVSTIRNDIRKGNWSSHGKIRRISVDCTTEVTFYRFSKETLIIPKSNGFGMKKKEKFVTEYRDGTVEKRSLAPAMY